MNTALVIGGTRNLGPDLVAALSQSYSVTILNRGKSGTPPEDAEILVADRSDPVALADALAGRSFDLVVDTTLYNGPDASFLAELLLGRAGRYVWWSTGQVYLVRTGVTRPFRERDYDGPTMPPPDPQDRFAFRNWEYGAAKRAAEDVLQTAHAARGFPAVALRMPMINSERDSYRRIAGYVHRLLDGGPIVTPLEAGPPLRHVYGKDVIAATLRAANTVGAEGMAINISQHETLELPDMLARLGRLVGAEPKLALVSREVLLARGLLPACSPFADPWMSSLDSTLSMQTLGMRYTKVDEYLPRCVEAALKLRRDDLPGYANRKEELELTI